MADQKDGAKREFERTRSSRCHKQIVMLVSRGACLNSGITLSSDHRYAIPYPGPWVQALMTTNSFSDQSTTSLHSSWIYLVYLTVKFVMWIVKQKIENKRNLFLKICWYHSHKHLIYNFDKYVYFSRWDSNPDDSKESYPTKL